MKLRTILPFAIILATSAAVAQTAPPPSTPAQESTPSAPLARPPAAPSMSEPSTTGTTPRQDANAPLAGANSFTEAQAKSRMEQNGFSSVSGLAKDEKGIWRGKAMKDGKSISVMLDFRGNVVSQ